MTPLKMCTNHLRKPTQKIAFNYMTDNIYIHLQVYPKLSITFK